MNKLVARLIIPFSGFFITKLPLSPVYFFLVGGGIIYFLSFLIVYKFPKQCLLPLAYFIFISISQYYVHGDFETTILVLVSISFYIIALAVVEYLSKNELIQLSEWLVNFSIPLLMVESVWRLTHPNANVPLESSSGEDIAFYMYKVSSIMYQDSNFVGIFIVTLFTFCCYLKTVNGKNYFYSRSILFFLTLFTICRAAIIVLIGFILINYIISKFSRISKRVFIYVGLFFAVFTFIIYSLAGSDDSLESKFMIIRLASNFIYNAPLHILLFGVGFGNTKFAIGIGAHNFFVTYIMESGILGFVFILTIWIRAIIASHYKLLYIILPFWGVGMSLAGHAISYMYVIFAIVIQLEKYELNTK